MTTIIKQGYLNKDPTGAGMGESANSYLGRPVGRRHRRLIVLREASIEWREDESHAPKGSLPLYHTTTVVEEGGVLLVSTDGKTLKLSPDSGRSTSMLAEWRDAIAAQVIAVAQQAMPAQAKLEKGTSAGAKLIEGRKVLGHKVLAALGYSETQRLQRLLRVQTEAPERRHDIDANLLRYLIDKGWAKRRKNEAQGGATALRDRCASPELLAEAQATLDALLAARAAAHEKLVSVMARSGKMAEQDVPALTSALEEARAVYLHHKTHMAGAELGHVFLSRASDWLQAVVEARSDAQRRLNAGMGVDPSQLDTRALSQAIDDNEKTGGDGVTRLDEARTKLDTARRDRRTSAAVVAQALPTGAMAHVQNLLPTEGQRAPARLSSLRCPALSSPIPPCPLPIPHALPPSH